jgi:hypothetical protein
MDCTSYKRFVDKKVEYKESEAETCINFLTKKSSEYKQRLKSAEFMTASLLTPKIQNIWVMTKIYQRIKELFPNKFKIYLLENNELMNLFVDLKDNIQGTNMMGLTAKESGPSTKLKCGSSVHLPENDDKPVSLCPICSAARCSVDLPLHMKEKHMNFIPEPIVKLKCGSPYHKKENDDKPVSLCKYCQEGRCSVDMPPHLLTKHKDQLTKEEADKLRLQLSPTLNPMPMPKSA